MVLATGMTGGMKAGYTRPEDVVLLAAWTVRSTNDSHGGER
jgi:hypothetical protein